MAESGAGDAPGPIPDGPASTEVLTAPDPAPPQPAANSGAQLETQAPRNPAAAILDDFLSILVKLDSDAFFWEPVQEKDAPRYFDVVKHPMDIQTMREKVGGSSTGQAPGIELDGI